MHVDFHQITKDYHILHIIHSQPMNTMLTIQIYRVDAFIISHLCACSCK